MKARKVPNGGSKLARPAKEITLSDIHRALNTGGLLHGASFSGSQSKVSSALDQVFADVARAVEKELDQTTLSQLVKKVTKKSKH